MDKQSEAVHGVPRAAPPLSGPVMFDQHWLDLAFLHWPVDPADVAAFLPRGVRPDVWTDGATYVGLVPFRMRHAGPGRHLPIPFFGSFLEWNVRLYSVDDAGRHGVVFRSLDADRLAVVGLARAVLRIPYRYAYIDTARHGADITWQLRRREGKHVTSRLVLRVGARVELTPLETFLTSRWGMHAQWGRHPIWIPNSHGPWPVRAAEVVELDDELVAAAGVHPIGPMSRALWTSGVHTRFGLPIRTGR